MKKLFILFILLSLTGCNKVVEENNLGAEISTSTKINIEKEILKIEKEQEKSNIGKYKYKEKYKKDNIDYTVHEYVDSNGDDGYQILINNSEFQQSIGYGIESTTRTWIRYIPTEATTSSSTSKIKPKPPKNITIEF